MCVLCTLFQKHKKTKLKVRRRFTASHHVYICERAPLGKVTVAICDTGSLMNSNRENIVLYSMNYCLHFEGEGPRGSPGPPPLLDEVIFKIELSQLA